MLNHSLECRVHKMSKYIQESFFISNVLEFKIFSKVQICFCTLSSGSSLYNPKVCRSLSSLSKLIQFHQNPNSNMNRNVTNFIKSNSNLQ